MFGKWLTRSTLSALDPSAQPLMEVVQRELPNSDQETWIVVTAIASLLGAVAFADREYSDVEEQRIRAELKLVQGMTPAGIDAISAALRARIREIATVEVPQQCNALREIADYDLRFEILGLLLEVAAADGSISRVESTLLREITQFLGLQQNYYTSLQAKHRDKLAMLKRQGS
ncbi:MAG TPA: TerB family tellurite resistance protein [Polyangiaceae bacterium]